MINLLFTASVAGGIVILTWYLSYPLSQKYFKASWHYAVLKITMVFMVFPISVFAPTFNNLFGKLYLQQELAHISDRIQRINIDAEMINYANSAFSNMSDGMQTTIPNIPYLQIIWLIVAAFLFFDGLRKMHKSKKQIINSSSNDVDFQTQKLFTQCKKELQVCNRITLRTSKYIKTPLVFGLTNPFVILPETNMNMHEKRLAFIHELTHIKNGDLWLKFFVFVISAVHWFNPLVHLLRRKISVVSEEYCDECVIRTMTDEERFLYGVLILKTVSDIAVPQVKYCSTLSASTKNLKRRLFKMMNYKKSRKGIIALSVIAAVTICSLATVYALSSNEDITAAGILVSNDYASENTLNFESTIDIDVSEDITTNSSVKDDYTYETVSETDISEDATQDSTSVDADSFDLTGNSTDADSWFVFDRDGQMHKVTASNTFILTYEEYVAFLEEFRAKNADKTFTFTNGNGKGEESVVSADEIVEHWYSLREKVKNGTTKFKQVIIDGEVLAWGDFNTP